MEVNKMRYLTNRNNDVFDDIFDNMFRAPVFGGESLMKTDVHEHDDHYEVDIDLPGFSKDEINLELKEGYLTVTAAKGLDEDNTTKKGKLIRQERYAGAMQRTFYVGENLTEEDIKAGFHNGVLSLTVAKKEQPKLPEKKTITIE